MPRAMSPPSPAPACSRAPISIASSMASTRTSSPSPTTTSITACAPARPVSAPSTRPQAVLRHLGSATRGNTYAEREHVALPRAPRRLSATRYLSEALDFPPRDLPLNPYHQRYAQTARPFRAIVLTHNLNFEGAPIFIFELAPLPRRTARRRGHHRVTAGRPAAGALRAARAEGRALGRLGVSGGEVTGRVRRRPKKAAAARNWDDIDVFVCNTMLTFWAVHLAAFARQALRPLHP